MQLAVLGDDRDALRIAERVARSGHQVVALLDCDSACAADRFPDAVDLDWESLLDDSLVDAVIVGREGSERRADQIRKLAQAAIPMLVLQPACEAIVGFEIEMIQRDTNCLIASHYPGWSHPTLEHLRQVVSSPDCPIGQLQQIVFERRLRERDAATVIRQLSQDVALIQPIVGEIKQVSALGGAGRESDLSNLSVNMSAAGGAIFRWSVSPGTARADANVSIVGDRGQLGIVLNAEEAEWRIDGGPDPSQWDSSRAAVEQLREAIEGVRAPSPSWPEVCRHMEIAETAERSVRKGKTFELYNEPHTEEATFKGVMAASGCLLLMIALAVIVVWGVIEGIRVPEKRSAMRAEMASREVAAATGDVVEDDSAKSKPAWPLWLRLWPVYPFAIFLLLQSLKLIVRPENEQADDVSAKTGGESSDQPIDASG